MSRMTASLFAASLLSAACSDALATPTTEIVIMDTDPVPGGNGGFARFLLPGFNDQGQVVIRAEIGATAGGNDDGWGLYLIDPTSGITEIAREGSPEPDGNGDFVFSFVGATINNNGQVATQGSYLTPGGSQTSRNNIYMYDPSTGLSNVVTETQPAPDGNGEVYSLGRVFPAINDAGRVALPVSLRNNTSGPAVQQAVVYSDNAGPLVQVARSAGPVPDGNGVFDNYFTNISRVGLNNTGQIVFGADIVQTTGGEADNAGLFITDGGTSLTQLVRKGETVPDGDGVFGSFYFPDINNAGQVAFDSLITGSVGGLETDEGLYIADATNGITKVVREFEPTPGNNGLFGTFTSHQLNDAGNVAFVSILYLPEQPFSGYGLFLADPDTGTIEVVREGTPAPDGNGVFNKSFSGQYAVNNDNMVSFGAYLDETSGGNADNGGVYVFTEEAGLLEIAREGDSLDGSTISSLTHVDNNDAGQVLYQFALADGRSGIAMWSPFLLGDLNGDGLFDNDDIDAFVMALTDRPGFEALYPWVDPDLAGDFSGDDRLTNRDIAGFVDRLTSPPASLLALVPEPSSLAVLAVGGLMLIRRR